MNIKNSQTADVNFNNSLSMHSIIETMARDEALWLEASQVIDGRGCPRFEDLIIQILKDFKVLIDKGGKPLGDRNFVFDVLARIGSFFAVSNTPPYQASSVESPIFTSLFNAVSATADSDRIEAQSKVWGVVRLNINDKNISGLISRIFTQAMCMTWNTPLWSFSNADRQVINNQEDMDGLRATALDRYTERIIVNAGDLAIRSGPLLGNSAMYEVPGRPAFVVEWSDL
jgi:hypothetical protein